MPSFLTRTISLCLTLASASAAADTSWSDVFSLSGFGTAGLARTDTNQAEFALTNHAAGARENFDYRTDSKLALQATARPLSWLSGTVQGLTEERIDTYLTTKFEWAFVKVTPLPGLSLRGGQMATPTFLVSDVRNVGYANTWLRAPDEVYGQARFYTYRGFDATYQHVLGPYSVTLNAYTGKSGAKLPPMFPGAPTVFLKAHDMVGYSVSLDLNTVSFRVSRSTAAVAFFTGPVLQGNGPYSFSSIAGKYEDHDVVAQAEFIERRAGISFINVNGYYLLGGYRLGKWLPYAIYAGGVQPAASAHPIGAEPVPVPGVPSGITPELTRSTISVGIRLDLFRSVDFKAQIDRVKSFPGGVPFIDVQPGFDNEAIVFSLSTDFVF